MEVGYVTLIRGEGKRTVGQGPVRTGVTAILPRGRASLDPVFAAVVQATEEAIVNALVAAETMTGFEGHKVMALPHDRLREVLKKYNRLKE